MVAEKLGLKPLPNFHGKAFKSVLPDLARGRFVVLVKNHAFAVVDGVVHDHKSPGAMKRVKAVYERSFEM